MENLGENFKKLREDMEGWGNPDLQTENEEERVYNETAAELLQEVSLSFPASTGQNTPAVNVFMLDTPSFVVLGSSQLSPPSLPMNTDVEMQDMRRRLEAVNSGLPVFKVVA